MGNQCSTDVEPRQRRRSLPANQLLLSKPLSSADTPVAVPVSAVGLTEKFSDKLARRASCSVAGVAPSKSPSISHKSLRIFQNADLNNGGSKKFLRKHNSIDAATRFSVKKARKNALDVCQECQIRSIELEYKLSNMEKQLAALKQDRERVENEKAQLQKQLKDIQTELLSARHSQRDALQTMGMYKGEMEKTAREFQIYRDNKESELKILQRTKLRLEKRLTKWAPLLSSLDLDRLSNTEVDSVPPSPGMNTAKNEFFGSMEWDSLSASVSNAALAGGALSMSELYRLLEAQQDADLTATCVSDTKPTAPVYEGLRKVPLISIYVLSEIDLENMRNSFLTQYSDILNTMLGSEHVLKFMALDLALLCKHTIHNVPFFEPHEAICLVVFAQEEASPAMQQVLQLFRLTAKFSDQSPKADETINVVLSVFCFPNGASERSSLGAHPDSLWHSVLRHVSSRVVCPAPNRNEQLKAAFLELDLYLRKELGMPSDPLDQAYAYSEAERYLSADRTCLFDDVFHECRALSVESEVGANVGLFMEHFHALNTRLMSPGPLSPLLISGGSGSGLTSLIVLWARYLKQNYGDQMLVLTHFLDRQRHATLDAQYMLRRFSRILKSKLFSNGSYVGLSPRAAAAAHLARNVAVDPEKLKQEFISLLERVSARYQYGIVLLLDGIHRAQGAEQQLNWLLDPVPIDCKVFVTARWDACVPAWRSWQAIHISNSLEGQAVEEVLKFHGVYSQFDDEFAQFLVAKLKTVDSCNLRYLYTVAKFLKQNPERLDSLLQCSSLKPLLGCMVSDIQQTAPTFRLQRLAKEVLVVLCCCLEGLSLLDLRKVICDLDNVSWFCLLEKLMAYGFVRLNCGLLQLSCSEVITAVKDEFKLDATAIRLKRQDLAKRLYGNDRLLYHRLLLLQYTQQMNDDRRTLRECLLQPETVVALLSQGRVGCWLALGLKCGFESSRLVQTCIRRIDTDINATVSGWERTLACLLLGNIACQLDLGGSVSLSCFERALEVCQVALDPSHVLVPLTQHHMATVYTQTGKCRDAEMLMKKCISKFRTIFGDGAPSVARELLALANLYRLQNKTALAEAVEKQLQECAHSAEQARKQQCAALSDDLTLTLGAVPKPEQMESTLKSARMMMEIGHMLSLQGNFVVAEEMLKHSLDVTEHLYGSEHSECALVLTYLGKMYRRQAEWQKAEHYFRRLFDIRRLDEAKQGGKQSGTASAATAKAALYLANALDQLGNLEEAAKVLLSLSLISDLCPDANSEVAPDHLAALCFAKLSAIYCQLGQHDKAEPLFQRAMATTSHKQGSTLFVDESVPKQQRLALLRNYARMQYDVGNHEEAAFLYLRSLPPGGSASAESSRRASVVGFSSMATLPTTRCGGLMPLEMSLNNLTSTSFGDLVVQNRKRHASFSAFRSKEH